MAGDIEQVRATDQRIRKQRKHEKKEHQKHITRRDLDVRDRFLGIKQIKSEFQPITYHFKHHKHKQRVTITENAEYAAKYLQDVTWGKKDKQGAPRKRSNTNIVKTFI